MADSKHRSDVVIPWLAEKEGQVWTAEDTERILRMFRLIEHDFTRVLVGRQGRG